MHCANLRVSARLRLRYPAAAAVERDLSALAALVSHHHPRLRPRLRFRPRLCLGRLLLLLLLRRRL